VNARPEFDVPNTTASQISDSSDSNWGKVQIVYPIKDIDTTSGTVNAGYITPTMEYNIGGEWTAITAGYLNSGALTNKSVLEGSYTTYTAYWDAVSQLGASVYTTTAQVRLTINDNEGANNSTSTTISNITIDTTAPSLTTFNLNSSTATSTVVITDDSNISWMMSNNSDGSADGVNTSYNDWIDLGTNSLNTTISWTFTSNDTWQYATVVARDIYGNTSTTTDVVPYKPLNFYYKDICNTAINDWREFTSWAQYTASTSAVFGSYKLYRSTDGANYSLLVTNTPDTLNYHVDTTVASTTTYYYKLTIEDSDGDISSFSDIISDLPNGQGGSDTTAPVISSVTVAETQATWARITWTTDEVSNSVVNYGLTTGYGSTETVNTMAVSHTVTLTGLTPSTLYYFRVKSSDINSNQATDDNSSAGHTFTTAGGATITDVSTIEVTDSTATITWNTDKSADSYVYYSINSSLTGASSAGSATRVATSTNSLYQHSVQLTGLTQRTKYYYYVQSTDADTNITTDTNGSNYYNFTTTYDNQAPAISAVTVAVRSSSALVMTWNTDEPATTQIYYGASDAYGSNTVLDTTFSRNHVVSLTGLTESTTYHFKAYSSDSAGNTASSTDQITSTTAANEVITVYVGGGGSAAPQTITDTTAPTISSIQVKDITAFSAVVEFNTDEMSTGFVDYGKDSSYANTAGSKSFKTNHSLNLSGLRLGLEYHFKVSALDKNGNMGQSSDQTFTTLFAAEAMENLKTLDNAEQFQEELESLIESFLPSLVPPFVSNLKVEDITEDSANIIWKTNIPSHGSLLLATDSAYDETKANPYITEVAEGGGKLADHKVAITDLLPATKYHVQAKAYVFPDVIGKSKDYTFFTKSAKTTLEITNIGNSEFTAFWKTNKETSSFVQYTNNTTNQKGQTGAEDLSKQHIVKVENLVPDTVYTVRVYGYDADNNLVEAEPLTVKTKKDIYPPQISSININSAFIPYKTDQLQTVISWKTNEPANSLVFFEEGVGIATDLKNKVGQENEYVLDHSVIITNFKPATIYRIKIVSSDEAKNTTQSPVRTILAPRASESVFEIITKNLEEAFGFLKNIGQ
ncbi:fibronectin type III domain-containing protein, partial [Patescibacteria group bacterium]|nr:fibronectin type III domain-containing protein [Patescibacteria group bacterium]